LNGLALQKGRADEYELVGGINGLDVGS